MPNWVIYWTGASPRTLFLLRSGVAVAVVCSLDTLEQEEVALSSDLAIHVRAVQKEGWCLLAADFAEQL